MQSISEPFIRRPVATTLLSIGLLLLGLVAYWFLPVAAFRTSILRQSLSMHFAPAPILR